MRGYIVCQDRLAVWAGLVTAVITIPVTVTHPVGVHTLQHRSSEHREWTDRRYHLVPTSTGPAVPGPAVPAPGSVSAWTNQRRVLTAVSTNPGSPVSAPGPGWAPHSASSLPSPQSRSPSPILWTNQR